MSKRKPSLEQKLLELALGSDSRDKEKRPRVERLAEMLWTRTLDGDRDSLKQLLERLPPQPQPAYPEPEAPPKVAETYESLTAALRTLVESGLIPHQLFEMYCGEKPQDVVEQ